MGATLKRPVIRGTLVLNTGSSPDTLTVSLPVDLDPAHSILFFTVYSAGPAPSTNTVQGQIIGTMGSTQLRFSRNTYDVAYPVNIQYEVLEFSSGVTVQRGTVSSNSFTDTGADITLDVSITSVNTNKSFPLVFVSNGGGSYGHNDFIKAAFTSSTVLRLSHSDATSPSTETNNVDWQVVEFTDGTTVAPYSVTSSSSSVTVNITSIDLNRSFLVTSYLYNNAGTNTGNEIYWTSRFSSSSQVILERGTSEAATDFTFYVVQLDSDASVLRGSGTILASTNTLAVTHSSVPLNTTAVFLTGFSGYGANTNNSGTRSPGGYGQIGITSRTSSGFTAVRGRTGTSTSTFYYQVLDFPLLPPWVPRITFF